ncbi:AAA family ATPase [Streptococcus danieliae]|uniref:AAA family ATPase n=2 Tax=Streptococcus danieliae TaxID=747656 RepID=A0A7X3KCL8_9STRE|nr:AAA family ATPase [Streptococcus danieliae]
MFKETHRRVMMKIADQHIRDEILGHDGSLVVRASAGSGKTTMMVQKIKSVLEDITNHKTVVATTFTRKATQEIRNKYHELGGEKSFLVITNDGFVEQEIIRPFINDAHRLMNPNFGDLCLSGLDETKVDFSKVDLSDFINDYSNTQFATYGQLLTNLIVNKKLSKYSDNNKNFKFELAFFILENSQACREYLASKYKMIFIDEYQDSDLKMNDLFMGVSRILCKLQSRV